MTSEPNLLSLIDEFDNTIDRLRRNFISRHRLHSKPVPTREEFAEECAGSPLRPGSSSEVEAFLELEDEARWASGVEERDEASATYTRFGEWCEFHRTSRDTISALADLLGYDHP